MKESGNRPLSKDFLWKLEPYSITFPMSVRPRLNPLKVSQTYTRYKTFLNELANDGVNLSKHEINVGFVNILPEKWLTFSQRLRNANHTQTLDLADIYGRFVYEHNLIQRRYSDSKKALITTPSSTTISTAFFSNNVIHDFQENFDDEIPKTFQPKNKGLVVETFDWDQKEVSNDEEGTQVKVLMALADDELTTGKKHAHNGEWNDITMRKEVSLFYHYLPDVEDMTFDVYALPSLVDSKNLLDRVSSLKCRAPRYQRNRNRDAPTRNAPVDTSTTNVLVVQDGRGGYD
nr:retrovirus-related Pol polyprotein from transposon TNT 1-94 [Tanacetum cinerariifolium]